MAAKVLVVDDTDSARDVAVRILRFYGIEASGARSADDCLNTLTRFSADLILLDVSMPDIDGFALLQRLRQDPKTRDIPVVMMTAIADSESIGRAFQLGACEYLVKAEFSAPRMLEVVRTYARPHHDGEALEGGTKKAGGDPGLGSPPINNGRGYS